MQNPAGSDKLIEELLGLVDDGTITDDERSIVTQAIQSQAATEEVNLKLIERLRTAMQSAGLPGEKQAVDKTLVQTIVQQLRDQGNSDVASHPTMPGSEPAYGEKRSQLRLGQLTGQIVGNYQVLHLIGRGGMGAVYEATDQLLHRRVALKIMLPEVAIREQNRARFLREARAAASVEHDHICPIYQVGDDHGTPFIAMPLLVGETLESRMGKRRLTYPEIIEIMQQVAEGLEAAHQIGLIHRDVKPANVWLEKRKDGSERVRLLDFGLAQMETEEPGLTQPGSVMGTPSYMSPEQARGYAVDARTDLFSAGAMLYELLTGVKPFDGTTPTAIISSILVDEPAEPKSIAAECPANLADLAMRLLQKDPAGRLASAAELQQALAACRSPIPPTIQLSASDVALPSHPVNASNAASPQVLPRAPLAQAPPQRTSWFRPVMIALAFGGIALGALFVFQTSNGTLIVETDDDSKVIFEKGELQVLDESGKVAYRISAKSLSEKVKPGKYQVRVAGADGLELDTNEFTIQRNKKTVIRVTAAAPQRDNAPHVEVSSTVQTLQSFRGKPLIAADFGGHDDLWPIPMVDNTYTVSQIENGRLIYKTRAHNPDFPFLSIPLIGKLSRGAFAIRCKTLHGALFFNFCTRQVDKSSRNLSLGINDGRWNLFIQRLDYEGTQRKRGKTTVVATASVSQPGLAKDDWLEVAFRWSEKDYAVWLNEHQIAGGTLPSDELSIGQLQPIDIGLRSSPDVLPELEVDAIALWDQSDVSFDEAKMYTPRNSP